MEGCIGSLHTGRGDRCGDNSNSIIKKSLDLFNLLCYIIYMSKKESKQLDFVLFMQVVAATRDVDPTDRLNAFAFDMNLIREGKQPTASKELI